ncbi:MAG: bacteriohemerythrin [Desulfuromonadales bacterium]
MAVEWTEQLAVGNETIDNQHKELFLRFNQLLEACRMRMGRENVVEMLSYLDEYVEFHFGEEERLMTRHSYPERESHFAQHRHFVAQLNELRQSMESRGPSLDLVVTTNQALIHWIVVHIKNVDVRLGTFLKTQSAA